MIDTDAIDYGLVTHKDSGMIAAIKKTLADGLTPAQIVTRLKAETNLTPSEIAEIGGAARYIEKTEPGGQSRQE